MFFSALFIALVFRRYNDKNDFEPDIEHTESALNKFQNKGLVIFTNSYK